MDELDFHHVNDALGKHSLWRDYLHRQVGILSNRKYENLYNFTKLRDAVMHGRVLFPTYKDFKESALAISKMGELIDYLSDYYESPRSGLPARSA